MAEKWLTLHKTNKMEAKKYLKISNNGKLNPILMMLMGGTTKENRPEAIGQFGTGFKYCMSYMLRKGLDFRCFIDGKEVLITHQEETVNDTIFKVLYVNGQRTSITDKMGRDWKPWYIIREIWSNAIDEGGAKREITTELKGEEGKTVFYLELDVEFLNVWNDWNKYFIQDLEPLHVQKGFKLYSGSSNSIKVYKQGVLVKEIPCDGGSVFSYDSDDCDLNELREVRTGVITNIVYKCLTRLDNPKMVEYFIENCTEKHYEGDEMDYGWEFLGGFNDVWKQTVGNAKLIYKEAKDKIEAKGVNIDTTGTIVVPEKIYKTLTQHFDGIGALRVASKNNDFFEYISPELEERVKQAMTVLEECDYFVHPELKFIYGEFGNKSTMAKVNFDTKEIFISTQFLNKPIFDICAMLIEENEHFNTGFEDETREFQQHFIDLYTKTLLEKHEIQV